MLITPESMYIGTVRVTGSCRDPQALRVGLGRLLAAVDLHPPGLPMRAIVCIRKLRPPLRDGRQSRARGERPGPDWQRAIVTALDEMLRHAAHPGHGIVPNHAEAVIFADYGELLACLASDWCRGEAATHWWWRSILRGQDVPGAVLRAWRESPEYIPAALQLLAGRGRAVSFAHALPTGEAYALVRSMTHRFGLPEIQMALKAGDQPRHREGDPMPVADSGGESPVSFADIPPLDSPWRHWIPESTDRGLSLEQRCLLGIGLMLQRAPAVVRSSAFVLAVRRWLQAVHQSEEGGSRHPTGGRALDEAPMREPDSAPAAGTAPAIEPSPQAVPPPEASRTRQATAAAVMTEESSPRHLSAAASEVERLGQPGLEGDLRGDSARTAQGEGVAAATHALQRRYEGASDTSVQGQIHLDRENSSAGLQSSDLRLSQPMPPPAWPGEMQFAGDSIAEPALSHSRKPGALDMADLQVDTEFGGLFFLINLGLFLNLYGDFTAPAEPGIALPVWDFVALLGQKLVGEEVHTDPVWGLLAHLSGRDEQVAPGADFKPPDIWRLPVDWLAPFPAGAIWHWQAIDGRLQVRHPTQFLVLDVPLARDDPVRQLRCALKDYGADLPVEPQPEPVPIDAGGTALLERWLGWLMPYVRARLHRALQMVDADELARMLCVHHARVFVTATHVDIVMALDALPIEIRLAGLDRDPGWVPAAGRFMAFHFE